MNESDQNDALNELYNEILVECYEYSSNCARADEEGWFYPDELDD